jgi:hypothetical protein
MYVYCTLYILQEQTHTHLLAEGVCVPVSRLDHLLQGLEGVVLRGGGVALHHLGLGDLQRGLRYRRLGRVYRGEREEERGGGGGGSRYQARYIIPEAKESARGEEQRTRRTRRCREGVKKFEERKTERGEERKGGGYDPLAPSPPPRRGPRGGCAGSAGRGRPAGPSSP